MSDERDYTLYVSNLPDKVSDKLLLELFSQAGPVDDVSLKKGFGFITFTHHVSVPYTLRLFQGLQLFGRQIVMKPREGSMYANQSGQGNRRQGNSMSSQNNAAPSSSNPRQLMNSQGGFGSHMRNVPPLLHNDGGGGASGGGSGGSGASSSFNQSWTSNFNSHPNGNFQSHRPNNPSGQSYDNRGGRNMASGSYRDHDRGSIESKKSSGFRSGRDQQHGSRQSMGDGESGMKQQFRDRNAHNWNNSGASRDFGQHPSGQGSMFGRRDSSQGDRNRFNDRQSSGGGVLGGFHMSTDSWARNSSDRSMKGNHSAQSGHFFDRNRRSDGQRPDRGGPQRPHHNDKPYNRQQNSRYSDGYPRNDANKFGRRP